MWLTQEVPFHKLIVYFTLCWERMPVPWHAGGMKLPTNYEDRIFLEGKGKATNIFEKVDSQMLCFLKS